MEEALTSYLRTVDLQEAFTFTLARDVGASLSDFSGTLLCVTSVLLLGTLLTYGVALSYVVILLWLGNSKYESLIQQILTYVDIILLVLGDGTLGYLLYRGAAENCPSLL